MIAGSRVVAACTLLGAGLFVMALLAAPALAAGKSVAVTYDQFSPSTITIRVGDTITWTNKDDAVRADHNVRSQSFKSGTLSWGESYKHTFGKAGTFAYSCTIHGTPGKVVVTAPTTPQPTRRPTPTPTRAPTPSPTPSPSPSPSPTVTASLTATQTSTSPTASSAIALSSMSTASAPADQATPVADTGSPSIVLVLVLALAVAGVVGLGAFAARRR